MVSASWSTSSGVSREAQLEESAARGPLFPRGALVVETHDPLSAAEVESLAEVVGSLLGSCSRQS